MKKILAIIPIAILIIFLSQTKLCNADTLNQLINDTRYVNLFVCKVSDNEYRVMADYLPSSTNYIEILAGLQIAKRSINNNYYSNLDVFYASFDPFSNPNTNMTGFSTSTPIGYFTTIICIKGSAIDNSNTENKYFPSVQDYEDFLNPPSDPTWWEDLWNTFEDYFTNPIPGGWIKNLINNIFGDENNENTITDSVDFTNPTLTPAPTPIPYTTVVIPKTDPVTGDTYYETNYYFNNPSGTPIIQPYPPTNEPAAGSPSGVVDYIPVNGDPYSIPIVNWLTSATIGDSNYDGLDSISDGMNSIDEIGSEYIDGIGAAQDATSTLPNSWLLLIGIAAAIPLLAGIISRFLS